LFINNNSSDFVQRGHCHVAGNRVTGVLMCSEPGSLLSFPYQCHLFILMVIEIQPLSSLLFNCRGSQGWPLSEEYLTLSPYYVIITTGHWCRDS